LRGLGVNGGMQPKDKEKFTVKKKFT
jgi:hypothetical protein